MRAHTEVVRKYYKYIHTEAFTPIFNSQEEAEFGKQNVKMITTPAAYGITGNSTIVLAHGNVLTFDLGEGSKNVSSLGYIGVAVGGQYPGIVLTTIQGSADAQTWETISESFGGRGDYRTDPLSIATPNNYRYIRFTTYSDDPRFGMGGAYGLVMYYDKRESIESTEDDYDFYKDISVAKSYSSSIRKYYKKRELIPTMTDYTTPYGEVTLVSGSYYTTNYPYQMFGQHIDSYWQTHIISNPFIVRYTFEEPVEPGTNILSFKYCQDTPIPTTHGNRALTSYIIEFNYSDGTSEIVVSKTDFINYACEFTYRAINSKQLVSVTITLTGNIYNTAWGSVYDFLMTHIVESTKEDHDFYLDEFSHSAYRKTTRKYYKYSSAPWTQPVLTDNEVLGKSPFAAFASSEYDYRYMAYKAFDNASSTDFTTLGTHVPSYIGFYSKQKLNVTNLNVYNRHESTEAFLSGAVYGSDDNLTWVKIKDFNNTQTAANANWQIDLSSNTNYYHYHKIQGETFSGTNQGFRDIYITATKQIAVDATEDDYDFYKDVDIDDIGEAA